MNGSTQEVHARWWVDEFSDRRWDAVLPYCRFLEDENSAEHFRLVDNHWLYHQKGLMGMDGQWETPILARKSGPSSTNVIEYNIDAVTTLISRFKPRITAQTDGGDWSTQKLAKDLGRWAEAEFKRRDVAGNNVYDTVTLMFRDAAWAGTGVLEPYEDHDTGRPTLERVLIDDYTVDQRECRTTGPRTLFRRRMVDVDVACERWPDYEDEIREAGKRGKYDWTWYRPVPEGQVVFVEAWHLPSGPGADDGMHWVGCEGATVLEEAYTEPFFPQIFFHWSPPVTGFYGRGLADILRAKQARINKETRSIERAEDLCARPRMFLHHNDGHLKDQIDNGIGSVFVTRTGRDYAFSTSAAMPAEAYAQRQRNIDEAALMAGSSEELASGGRVPGVESAVGMRQVREREIGRHANLAERLEAVYVQVAEKLIKIQKSIGGERVVVWNDGNLMKRIPWSRVDLSEDEYVIQLQPSNPLARDLSGRIQEVIELAQANALTKEQMMKLLNHPDLQEEYDLGTSAIRSSDRVMEVLEDEEAEFPVPDVLDDLELCKSRVHARYLDIKWMKAPERVLQRFRDYIRIAIQTLEQATAAAAAKASAAMQAGMATAVPGMMGSPLSNPAVVDPDASMMNAPGGLVDNAMKVGPGAMELQPQP